MAQPLEVVVVDDTPEDPAAEVAAATAEAVAGAVAEVASAAIVAGGDTVTRGELDAALAAQRAELVGMIGGVAAEAAEADAVVLETAVAASEEAATEEIDDRVEVEVDEAVNAPEPRSENGSQSHPEREKPKPTYGNRFLFGARR